MSVVSTAGAVLYEQTIDRSKHKLTDRRHGRDAKSRLHLLHLLHLGPRAGARVRAQLARPRWWKLVGAVSLGVFVVAIGAVTAIEAGVGKPMAAAVTGQASSAGTSLRLAAGGGEPGPTPTRAGREGKPGEAGRDGTGEGHNDRSSPAPTTDQPPPGTVEPDQDTSPTAPGAESGEETPPAPSATEEPEDGDQPLAPTPSPTPAR